MSIFEKTESFIKNFNGKTGVMGYSVKNKPIYYACVKKSEFPKVIVQCAIHAREYITTHLCLELIERFEKIGKVGCVYFVPLMNPDGVEICQKEKPFYKANARGVDLNVNFDAGWGKGLHNVFCVNDENYVGERPFSEPETIALRDFTLKVNPNLTISYHSKGEEIYYEFFQSKKDKKRDFQIAKCASKVTGYKIKCPKNSFGGYKDWCIQTLKIPSLTIEVGRDELVHPIAEEHLDEIYQKNKDLLFAVINRLKEIKCN